MNFVALEGILRVLSLFQVSVIKVLRMTILNHINVAVDYVVNKILDIVGGLNTRDKVHYYQDFNLIIFVILQK